MKLVFRSDVDRVQESIVDSYAGGPDVVGEVCGVTLRLAPGREARNLRVVEDAAAVQGLRERFDPVIVQDVAPANFVGAFVDVCDGTGVVDLVKLGFDSPVIFEVEVDVGASTFDLLGDIVRVGVVEFAASLKDSSAGGGGERLGVQADTSEADQAKQGRDLELREEICCPLRELLWGGSVTHCVFSLDAYGFYCGD